MPIAPLLDSYLLTHDLKPSSERWYRTVAAIFERRAGELTAENVSRFLAELQRQGRSADYRKGLRNCLVALLRFQGDAGKVRPVKLTTLQHSVWNAQDISRLLSAVDVLFSKESERVYWRTLVQAAYWSGLSQCDLHILERRHIANDGTVKGERCKTGKAFLTYIPPDLVSHVASGTIWPLRTSGEYFRRTFRKIVSQAGLRGTFKTLRKSSGSSVERLHPGQGHRHLANSRAIFERHYWFERDAKPLRPEPPLAG